ncbi:InlB B-repeat-containing protein [Sharpea azabuensis]|uniref:InlB B-repeat-containing protein n=1 Tax=Sharpea azabuensis TaxID=322505 RepID=UPI002E814546|nr:InlB B-repeat-containing protein [Sharpea azabuensis]MEE3307840.1 InlB B-repeat-containing protein [Sharpea azabuensis]
MSSIIKTKQAFTIRDASTGSLTSFAYNSVYTVADALATSLIADGLAEAYTEIDPSGTVSITENGLADVTQYEKANVSVPLPEGSTTVTANGTYDITDYKSVVVNVGTATVTYNVNGGTGDVDAQTVIKGNAITLDDGSGITPPDEKTFSGWATTNDATEPDAESPYTVTEDVTLYAVYTATE